MILSCLLALLVILPTIVLVSLRWSLSPVVSFVKRRFRLFDSWKLTRGHVWRLLAAYLLGAIFSFVVTAGIVLVAGIAALIVFFTSGARNAYALHGVSLDTALVLAPTYAAFFLPFAMSQIIGLAVMNAIPAYVYRHITSPPEAT